MSTPPESKPFKEALKKALVPTIEFHQGEIFSVDDDPKNPIVKFPEDNLPETERSKHKRTFHKQRYVLIVQSDKANSDLALPSVLVAPLSSIGRTTEYSVIIPTEYLASHIPGDSVAHINLTQPVLKIFLREKAGNVQINSETFQKVRAVYLRMLGII